MKTIEELKTENALLQAAVLNMELKNQLVMRGQNPKDILGTIPKKCPESCPKVSTFMGKPEKYWVELEKAAKKAHDYLGGCRADGKHLQGKDSFVPYNKLNKALNG